MKSMFWVIVSLLCIGRCLAQQLPNDGTLVLGMTAEQVQAMWGPPQGTANPSGSITPGEGISPRQAWIKIIYPRKGYEQWIYPRKARDGNGHSLDVILFFSNGVLVLWSNG
jgi:hypothetical protein